MITKIFSAAMIGLSGVLVTVEIDISFHGLPRFTIVGLPDKAVEESKDRVKTAIRNSQLKFPEKKITVNLAPSDIPKQGSHYDVAIALGILAGIKAISTDKFADTLYLGSLSLDGKLESIPGVLPMAAFAKEAGLKRVVVPFQNKDEAALVADLEVIPIHSLSHLVHYCNNQVEIAPVTNHQPTTHLRPISHQSEQNEVVTDFRDVKGQQNVKRALEIAAAGGHNVLLKGPPGAGKTMLARAMPSILPPLDNEEMIEVAKIYSLVHAFQKEHLTIQRPFRAPHHIISRTALIGGGTEVKPGEVSLAHRGVLFLDEFPEYPHSVIESLRQPLEDGFVTVSRASRTLQFPSRFILIAAYNPCPCGYLGHPKKPCTCSMAHILSYQKRISGPIIDRIDIRVDVTTPTHEDIVTNPMQKDESSTAIQARVLAVRAIQKERFKNVNIKTNSEMSSKDIKHFCKITPNALQILKKAYNSLSLSARSYFKVIKISQTIADLDNAPEITEEHILEALQYRSRD